MKTHCPRIKYPLSVSPSRLNREFSRGRVAKSIIKEGKKCHEKMKGNNEIVANAGEDWISLGFLI
jgi:hypothetical protein